MAGDRIINTGGGNYNEAIYGNYIENYVQGNHINLSQDVHQSVTQIQQLLAELQTQGYSPEKAKQEAANQLAIIVRNNPTARAKLEKLWQYLSDAAIAGLVGDATVEVVKLVLRLTGIPIV